MKYILALALFLSPMLVAGNYTVFFAPVSFSSTTASTLALASNSMRTYLLIQNTGSTSIIVKFGSVQSASEGVTIPAGWNYEPNLAPTNSVWIKSASGTNAVTIQQGN